MRASGDVWLRVVALLLVIGLYVTSFFLPVLAIPLVDQPALSRVKVEVANHSGAGEVVSVEGSSVFVIKGYEAFRGGPSGGGWADGAAWCANPVLWAGCLLLAARRWRLTALAGCLALVLGSAMLLAVVINYARADIRWSVADYRVGYWLWLGSMALLVLAALVGRRVGQRQPPSAAEPN